MYTFIMVWYNPTTWFKKATVTTITIPAKTLPPPTPTPSPAPTTSSGGGGRTGGVISGGSTGGAGGTGGSGVGSIGGLSSGGSSQQEIDTAFSLNQQRLSSQRASQQARMIQPSRIDVAKPSWERSFDIGTGETKPKPKFIPTVKQAGRDLFVGGSLIDAFGTMGSLFDSKQKKGDVPFTYGKSYGTIQTGTAIKGTGALTTTTEFQLLREEGLDAEKFLPASFRYQRDVDQISKDVSAPIQKDIDLGRIDLDTGMKRFDAEFGRRTANIDTKKYQSSDIFTSKVIAAEKPAFSGSGTAQIVGIGAASLTPVGAAMVGTSFVGSGQQKIGKGFLGEDLSFKQRSVLVGTGGFEAGLGFTGGGLAFKGAERSADRLLIKEITAKEGTITGREIFKSKDLNVFATRSTRNLGGEASMTTDLITPVYRSARKPTIKRSEFGQEIILDEGGEIFSITGGRGRTTSKIFSIEKGKFIESESTFGFQSPNLQRGEAKSFLGGLRTSTKGTEGFMGDVIVTQKGKDIFKVAKVGGTSKQFKKDFGTFTGVKGGAVKSNLYPRVKKGGFIFERTAPLQNVKVQERGLILNLESTEATGVKVFQPSGAKKTPLSKTFQQTTQQVTPVGLAPQIESQLIKPATSLKTPTTTTSTGGLRLTQTTTPKSKSNLLTAQAPASQLLARQQDKSSLKFAGGLGTSLATTPVSRQRIKTTPALRQSLKQTSTLKQPTPLIPSFKKITPRTRTPSARPRFRLPAFKLGLPSSKYSSSLFKRTSRRGKPPKRTPSLFAIGRNIKAPTVARGESSALTIRPILTKRKKKKVKGGKK